MFGTQHVCMPVQGRCMSACNGGNVWCATCMHASGSRVSQAEGLFLLLPSVSQAQSHCAESGCVKWHLAKLQTQLVADAIYSNYL